VCHSPAGLCLGMDNFDYQKQSEKFFFYFHCPVTLPNRWLGVLQIGIRAHGFNIEPGWATNVEFGVKIPQGFDVQSARAALRELLGGNGKLRRYSGSRKSAEKRDHGNRGFGTTKFKFGPLDLFGKGQTPHNHWIWRRCMEVKHRSPSDFTPPDHFKTIAEKIVEARSSEVPEPRSPEVWNQSRPSISRDTCPQIKKCSEFDSLGVVWCSTVKSSEVPEHRSDVDLFGSSTFRSYKVCWNGISRSPKCRSPEVSDMMWHDDIT
jgi:hypothetical protein